MPPFDQSIAAIVLSAKEAVLAPMRPSLRRHALTEAQWRVLRVIADRGATDITGLAQTGLLHAPSVTRILRELSERGLVVRLGTATDRRRASVTLTEEGHAIVNVVSTDVARIWRAYAERFGDRRLDSLLDELRALTAAIATVE